MTDNTHEHRPFADLRDAGLLWLINRTVFHPRGWALGLEMRGGEAVGWTLLGDGVEPWTYGDVDEREMLHQAEQTLRPVIREEKP